jgi:hypothetical protein
MIKDTKAKQFKMNVMLKSGLSFEAKFELVPEE